MNARNHIVVSEKVVEAPEPISRGWPRRPTRLTHPTPSCHCGQVTWRRMCRFVLRYSFERASDGADSCNTDTD